MWLCGIFGRDKDSSSPKKPYDDEWEAKRSCLPQVDPFPAERKAQLFRQKKYYPVDDREDFQYRLDERYPPSILMLPTCEEYADRTAYKEKDFAHQINCVMREFMGPETDSILKSEARWSSFREMDQFFKSKDSACGFPRPSVMDKWWDDAEFCRQRLSGVHPCGLTALRKRELLPKEFEVTDEMVAGLMDDYETLDEAIAAKRVYMVDHTTTLAEIQSKPGCYLTSPVALFYCNNVGELSPLAIQLYGKTDYYANDYKGLLNPVFTPHDNKYAWQMAKMYFNSADMHVHIIGTYVIRCVLIAGIITSITYRNLSIHHPLRQLLAPHFANNLAHLERVWTTLLAKKGPLADILSCGFEGMYQIARKAWDAFDFSNMTFKHDWMGRVDQQSEILGFRYRDDGMLLWQSIEDYVRQVVRRYYQKPDDIDDDIELQHWIRELSRGLTRIVELQPQRKEEPIVFNLTSIIFNCTGFHSASTHGLYEQYACVANAPASLVKPPFFNKSKDEITEKDLLSALPSISMTLKQIAMAYVLSGYSRNLKMEDPKSSVGIDRCRTCDSTHTMLNYPAGTYADRSNEDYVRRFQQSLQEVSATIKQRNQGTASPYTALDPDYLARSLGLNAVG